MAARMPYTIVQIVNNKSLGGLDCKYSQSATAAAAEVKRRERRGEERREDKREKRRKEEDALAYRHIDTHTHIYTLIYPGIDI